MAVPAVNNKIAYTVCLLNSYVIITYYIFYVGDLTHVIYTKAMY